MTLWEIKENQIYKVKGFDPAHNHPFLRRLQDWGFIEGAPVRCLKRTPFGGPRVFEIGSGVYTLERQAAHLIEVETA